MIDIWKPGNQDTPRSPEILIVSEDPSIHGSILDSIKRLGIVVNMVQEGQLLPQKLPTRKPDLIILDFSLPMMDGIAVCRQLKSTDHTRDIPVVLMFARDDIDSRAMGFQAGAVDYLLKPLMLEEFMSKLRLHVRQRTVPLQAASLQEFQAKREQQSRDDAYRLDQEPSCEVCTEQSLLKRYFRDIFHNLSDSIYLLEVIEDGRFRYLETNRAFEASAGVPEDGLRGEYVGDLLRSLEDEAMIEKAIAKFRRCLETGSVIDEEITLELQSGRRICRSTLTPLFDDSGRINRILGVSRDITESKQAEILLVQREREFRTLAENSTNLIVRYDRECRRVYTNPAHVRLISAVYGHSAQGHSPDVGWLATNVSAEEYKQALQRAMETGVTEGILLEWLDQEGQIRSHMFNLVPEYDTSGVCTGVLGLAHDVSDLKRTELRLRLREREFRTLAENSPDNIMRYDHARRILYMNRRKLETLGLPTADGLIGKTCSEIWSLEDTDPYEETLKQVITRNTALTFDTTHLDIGNGLRYHSIHIVPEHSDAGEVIGALAIGRDISESKRMEKERQGHLHFFESMDRVNRAIQGSNDMETALNEVLDTVLAIFDCDRAFFVYPCDPEADSWSVPFERTRPEYPGALALGLMIAMDDGISSSFRILLDASGPVAYGPGNQHPLPGEMSEQFGFKSMMSLAVYPKGHKPWHFGIHQCSRARVWNADENKLFREIGRRLADGLNSLLAYRDIKEREQKFQALADSMPDIVAAYDLQLRKTYANRNLEQYLAEDIDGAWLGKTPRELYPSGELDEYQTRLEEIIKTGTCDDLLWQKPDGQDGFFFYQTHFAALRDPNGIIIGELAITIDVTKSQQLELDLIRSGREFRTLAENLPDIIIRYDRSFRRIYINKHYSKMLESVGVDILGKTPLECWWAMEPNAEQFTRILQQVVETGNPETTLIQAETRAGKIIYWTMKLVPEFDQEGVVTGVLSCATDITELKEYQRQVEASQMQLRALAIRSEKLREDERKRLARDLHDDLGQRLTALKLDLARLTLRFGQSNPELQKQVQEMELDMGATILIVRDVATQLRPSALEMGIVSGLEWLILEFRKRSNIKCQLRIPKHKLALDDHQDTALFHIVQESLTNIMRHAMATEVKIILSCDVQYYVLEISDNGVGFDAKKRKTGSFGLIGIEERALSLGGDMHIETALNQGLKLTIRIPVFHAIGEKL